MNNIVTAVKTNRKIQNIATGLDVVVPDFVRLEKSEKLKGPKIVYHVIVTTNRSPENLANENHLNIYGNTAVHYAFDKEFREFVKLRSDLDKRYSGTYVPTIEISERFSDKLAFAGRASWKECREKQVAIDKFMKWCAQTPKIAASPILIEFLGLNRLKQNADKDKSSQNDKQSKTNEVKQTYKEEDLFGEPDFAKDQKGDLFEEEGKNDEEVKVQDLTNIPQTFGEIRSSGKRKINLFETEDLTGTVSINDDKLIVLNEEENQKNVDLTNPIIEKDDPGLFEVNENVSGLVSQLQKVNVKVAKSSPPSTKPTSNSPKADPSTPLAVEGMMERDLLNYIKENEDKPDDDLNLGF